MSRQEDLLICRRRTPVLTNANFVQRQRDAKDVINKAVIESKAASKALIEAAKAQKVAPQATKTVVYLRLKAF